MIKIRIEFVKEYERKAFIDHIETEYDVIDRSEIKPSKDPKTLRKIQFLEVELKSQE